jgi:hypothetical protein
MKIRLLTIAVAAAFALVGQYNIASAKSPTSSTKKHHHKKHNKKTAGMKLTGPATATPSLP